MGEEPWSAVARSALGPVLPGSRAGRAARLGYAYQLTLESTGSATFDVVDGLVKHTGSMSASFTVTSRWRSPSTTWREASPADAIGSRRDDDDARAAIKRYRRAQRDAPAAIKALIVNEERLAEKVADLLERDEPAKLRKALKQLDAVSDVLRDKSKGTELGKLRGKALKALRDLRGAQR